MITIRNSLLAAGLLAASTASAITIDTVLVGNAGNANDSTGYGGVGYNYHIGTYEVTNSQYTAFLNAKAATDPHALYRRPKSKFLFRERARPPSFELRCLKRVQNLSPGSA